MSTFAVARLHQVTLAPPIVEYLERIDSTLTPFGGRFVVHGGPVELPEGSWSSNSSAAQHYQLSVAHSEDEVRKLNGRIEALSQVVLERRGVTDTRRYLRQPFAAQKTKVTDSHETNVSVD